MYKEIGLYGYILLFIYYLINASNNINNNESNSIIFGSFCIIFGFIFIIIEKYKNIKYINLKNNFLYGPIILALFNFFSLFFVINKNNSFITIFAIIGNILLIKKYNDDIHIIGLIIMFLYYFLFLLTNFNNGFNLIISNCAIIMILFYLLFEIYYTIDNKKINTIYFKINKMILI